MTKYELRELTYDALAPWVALAEGQNRLLAHPANPFSHMPMGRHMRAANELFTRIGRRYEKPSFNIASVEIDGSNVAVREEIVASFPFCDLRRFTLERSREVGRVLAVAPLSGHHATLLRDMVRELVVDFDVYVTDWRDAKLVPLAEGAFALDDYVEYIRRFVHLIGPGTGVVSVCQPAVPVLAAVSLMSEDNDPSTPRAMVMMGGPIDTRRGATAVTRFAEEHSEEWFAKELIQTVPDRFPGSGRHVYPGSLQLMGFVAMNAERHHRSYLDFARHIVGGDDERAQANRTFYEEFNAVLDMPAEYYLDTVRGVFQRRDLANGTMHVRERLVRPETIRDSALFTIEGERDDISGVGQTQAAHDICSSIPTDRREHLLVEGTGHFGIFSGSRFRELVSPQIRSFLSRSMRISK
ncbi:MAG TPA: polyhydroxyalkanoate depolymerase [Candidatus Baltobacteraceae bacterium]|nr:polyhydroxyalkanoate depolymerase [Candidatus Baltobacteraceae bacterium]